MTNARYINELSDFLDDTCKKNSENKLLVIQKNRNELLNIEKSLVTASSKAVIDTNQITDKVSKLLDYLIKHSEDYKTLIVAPKTKENEPSKTGFEEELTALFIQKTPQGLDKEEKKNDALQKLNKVFLTYLHCLDALTILSNYRTQLDSSLTQYKQYEKIISLLKYLCTDTFMAFCDKHYETLAIATKHSSTKNPSKHFNMFYFYLGNVTRFFIQPFKSLLTISDSGHIIWLTSKSDNQQPEKNIDIIPMKAIDDFYVKLLEIVEKKLESVPKLNKLQSANNTNLEQHIETINSWLQFFMAFQEDIEGILKKNNLSTQAIFIEKLLISTDIMRIYTDYYLKCLLRPIHDSYKELLDHLTQMITSSENQLSNKMLKKLTTLFKRTCQFLEKKNFFFFQKTKAELYRLCDPNGETLDTNLTEEEEKKLAKKTEELYEKINTFLHPKKTEKKPTLGPRKTPPEKKTYPTPRELTPEEMQSDKGARTISADDFESQVRNHIDHYLAIIQNYRQAMVEQSRFITKILNPTYGPSYNRIVCIVNQSEKLDKEKKKFEEATFPLTLALQLKPNDPKRIELYTRLNQLHNIGQDLYKSSTEFNKKLPEFKKKIIDKRNSPSTNQSTTSINQTKTNPGNNNKKPKIPLDDLINKATKATENQQSIRFTDEIQRFISSTRENKFSRENMQVALPKRIKNAFEDLSTYTKNKTPEAQVKLVGSTIESLVTDTKTKKDLDFQIIIDPGQEIKEPEENNWLVQKTMEMTAFIAENGLFPGYRCGPAKHIPGLIILTQLNQKIDIQLIVRKYQPILNIHEPSIDSEGNVEGSVESKKDLVDKMLRPAKDINISEAIKSDIKLVFMLIKKHLEGYQYDTEVKKALDTLVINQETNQAVIANKIKQVYRLFGDDFLKELIKLGIDHKLLATFSKDDISEKATLSEKINLIKEKFKALKWIDEANEKNHLISHAGFYSSRRKENNTGVSTAFTESKETMTLKKG